MKDEAGYRASIERTLKLLEKRIIKLEEARPQSPCGCDLGVDFTAIKYEIKDCPTHGVNKPVSTPPSDWEEEFDAMFGETHMQSKPDGTSGKVRIVRGDIKDFVRTLLSQQRQEVIEEIERMKINSMEGLGYSKIIEVILDRLEKGKK